MNLKRLKFAWARGARLQCQYPPEKWPYTVWVPVNYPEVGARIHPDDEHLQYGPLSTALRKRPFEAFEAFDSKPALLAMAWAVEAYGDGSSVEGHIHDWMMFDLFVAELLADEGL